jgi:hypothetical protein
MSNLKPRCFEVSLLFELFYNAAVILKIQPIYIINSENIQERKWGQTTALIVFQTKYVFNMFGESGFNWDHMWPICPKQPEN